MVKYQESWTSFLSQISDNGSIIWESHCQFLQDEEGDC